MGPWAEIPRAHGQGSGGHRQQKWRKPSSEIFEIKKLIFHSEYIYFPSFCDGTTALACTSLHRTWRGGSHVLSYMWARFWDFFVCLKEVLPTPSALQRTKFKVCDATDLWALSGKQPQSALPSPSPSLPNRSARFSLSCQLLCREEPWSWSDNINEQ